MVGEDGVDAVGRDAGAIVAQQAVAIERSDTALSLHGKLREAAASLLRSNDPTLKDIEVQFFGDSKPLITSGARVADPKSRRVEILVF